MKEKIFKVEGMSCSHCERNIKNALTQLDGVKTVEVSLKNKTVIVEFDQGVNEKTISDKITDLGYDVVE